MMWLAWRQHRRQMLFTVLALVALAAFIVPTGLAMRADYADLGIAACLDQMRTTEATPICNAAMNRFGDKYETWLFAGILFLVLPLLAGLFWGAPLVAREVEQGTHRLVWTQGITRRRWAATKVGLTTAVAAVAATAYGLGVSWWLAPMHDGGQQSRLDWLLYDMQGVAPIGYTLFAVAVGVFAGTVWRKMLPAMAAVLTGFAAVRVAVTVLARPRFQAPEETTVPIVGGEPWQLRDGSGDWMLTGGVRNPDGQILVEDGHIVCPAEGTGPTGQPCGAEMGAEPGAYNWLVFHPADRFWPFQIIETGVYVALAALLIYLAVRRIRRIA